MSKTKGSTLKCPEYFRAKVLPIKPAEAPIPVIRKRTINSMILRPLQSYIIMQLLGVYLVINLKQLIMKGTLRLFLTLCMAVLSMTLVQAQERTYSGVVKGSDGQPIIGASVEVVGTTVGTSTGLDGDYTIKAKQGSKIKYSFLGTKSVTATAGASSTINVTLEDDAMGIGGSRCTGFRYRQEKRPDGCCQLNRLETDQLTIQLDAVACARGFDPRLAGGFDRRPARCRHGYPYPRYRFRDPEQLECTDRDRRCT